MPDVYELAQSFRAEILANERTAATAMVRAYAQVYVRIQADAAAVLDAIDHAEKVGDVPGGLASKKRRLEALRTQVLDQIHGFARYADAAISQQQRDAVYLGGEHARQLVFAGMGDAPPGVVVPFNRLPAAAVESMVGTFQPGSPVAALLDTLAPSVVLRVQGVMVAGLALGKNPKTISREIRQAAGEGLSRALTISRTETMRSYRTASLDVYQSNPEVVTKWRWTCSFSRRTCGMCLGMDGQEFDLDVPMGSHPNCRCVPVPVTKTWAEMGYDAPEPLTRPRDTGAEWFARQSPSVQEEILGPGKLNLYVKGKLKLSDLAVCHDDPQWGPTRSEKPLKDL